MKEKKLDHTISIDSDESTDNDHLLIDATSMDESYPLKVKTTVNDKTLKKLNEKYDPVIKKN